MKIKLKDLRSIIKEEAESSYSKKPNSFAVGDTFKLLSHKGPVTIEVLNIWVTGLAYGNPETFIEYSYNGSGLNGIEKNSVTAFGKLFDR